MMFVLFMIILCTAWVVSFVYDVLCIELYCITGFAATVSIIGFLSERRSWNNGVCPKCVKGFWKSTDTDSQGGTLYSCSFCDNYHWQSGWYDYWINKRYKNESIVSR